MPTYNFRNKLTGKETQAFMPMSERETYLKENPDLEQTPNNISLGDPLLLGRVKPDPRFVQHVNSIHKRNKGVGHSF